MDPDSCTCISSFFSWIIVSCIWFWMKEFWSELIESCLDFLHKKYIRIVEINEVFDLSLIRRRTDTIHIPGDDTHRVLIIVS